MGQSAFDSPRKDAGKGEPKVMVVEDDASSRLVLRHILTKGGGADVAEARDGIEAWELLESGYKPDLTFLDIHMPRMDGMELLRQIRGDTKKSHLKVCFCSAIKERTVVEQACTMKPDYYVLKPFTPQTILTILDKVRHSGESDAALLLDPQTRMQHDLEVCIANLEKYIQGLASASHPVKADAAHTSSKESQRLYDTVVSLMKSFPATSHANTHTSPEAFLSGFARELLKSLTHVHESIGSLQSAKHLELPEHSAYNSADHPGNRLNGGRF